MNQPEIFDSDIRALQQSLRAAWLQLGDPSLTAFTRRELRNQMKQWSADLKAQLEKAAARQPPAMSSSSRNFSKPELRILA
jgi:hypothetical protein